MTIHKQVEIYSPLSERNINVDEGIAELIELLHKLDILTFLSCQENQPGIMWINFPSEDADVFLSICASGRDEDFIDFENSLYGRMMNENVPQSWHYTAHFHDWSEKYDEKKDEVCYDGDSYITSSISVRFPISDYTLIMERIQSHLKNTSDLVEEVIPEENS